MREKPGLDLSDHGTVPSSSGNLTQEGTTSAWVAVRVHTFFQPCHQTNASGEGRRAAPAYAIAEPGVETPGRELERTRLTHARMPLTPGSSGKMAAGSISSDRVRIRRMHRSTQTDAPAPPLALRICRGAATVFFVIAWFLISVLPACSENSSTPETQALEAVSGHPALTSRGARVLGVTCARGVLIVDLSEEMLAAQDHEARPFEAIASALAREVPEVRKNALVFRVEGKPVDTCSPEPPGAGLARTTPPQITGGGPLAGRKIALNPGHGLYRNEDYGWVWQREEFSDIREDLINSEIQMHVAELLSELGAIVIPLRELDHDAGVGVSAEPRWYEAARHYLEFLAVPPWVWNEATTGWNIHKDINSRPRGAIYFDADLLISVHNNERPLTITQKLTGTETYFDSTGECHDPHLARALADSVHSHVVQSIRAEYDEDWVDRGVRASEFVYGELWLATMPTCLIEAAFMDNEFRDNVALHDDRFLRLVAKGIVAGICEYLGESCQPSVSWVPIVQSPGHPAAAPSPTPAPLPMALLLPLVLR